MSFSKSSKSCKWFFVHNKTKINKQINRTFNFKQELLTTIPQVQSYSKSSMSCNRFFVQNKTKINKLIIGTFDNNRNFWQQLFSELLTTIELLIKLFQLIAMANLHPICSVLRYEGDILLHRVVQSLPRSRRDCLLGLGQSPRSPPGEAKVYVYRGTEEACWSLIRNASQ